MKTDILITNSLWESSVSYRPSCYKKGSQRCFHNSFCVVSVLARRAVTRSLCRHIKDTMYNNYLHLLGSFMNVLKNFSVDRDYCPKTEESDIVLGNQV